MDKLNKEINFNFYTFKSSYDILSSRYEGAKLRPVDDVMQELPLSIIKEMDSETGKYLKNTLEKLKSLQSILDTNKKFTIFSSHSIYESGYENEFKKFVSNYPEQNENQFINRNIEKLNKAISYYELLETELVYSFRKKIKFLQDKVMSLSHLSLDNKSPSLTNLEMVHLLNKLKILKFLRDSGYTNVQISKLIGKILGKHSQESRKFLSQIDNPANFGDAQTTSMKVIDEFLNSL